MQGRSWSSLPAFGVLGASLLWSGYAAADAKECAAAYESAQELQQETQLRQAREQLLVCAQDSCPDFIKADCGKWLDEVDEAMPSVVFVVRDADGNDLVDVSVEVGGETLVQTLDGKSVNVNPGRQEFTFLVEGRDPISKTVLITQGEKNRAINVQIGADTGESGGTSVGTEDLEKAPNRTLAYVFGGVGVAALGSFAAFAIIGKNDEDSLRKNCAPNCEQSKVDDVRTKYRIADVSLVIGIASLGVGTYFFLRPPGGGEGPDSAKRKKPKVAVDVGASRRGGFATVVGTF